MQTDLLSLDVIQVASPCTAPWEEMVGDDRVRFCGQCRLNVYNLSEMTRADATRFMQNRESRTCIRFYRRADGTVLTRDCPVGLRAVRRRIARMAAAIVAVCGAMMAGTLFAWSGSMNGRRTTNASSAVSSPKTTFLQWLAPPPTWTAVQGGCPPPPSPSVTPQIVLGKMAAPADSAR